MLNVVGSRHALLLTGVVASYPDLINRWRRTPTPGPIQLHHGTADASVPLAFSETLYQQIVAVNETVELYTYTGTDHNIASSFGLAMQRTIEFFDKHLKGPQA